MKQLSFFAAPKLEEPEVPGLLYVPDWLSRDDERALLEAVYRRPWKTEWRRRRQVYGVRYAVASAGEPSDTVIPSFLDPLIARVLAEGRLDAPVVNVVVNEYLSGQGIALHHDYAAFGPTVVAVSLGGAAILELDDPETGREASLDMAPRSLWSMGGEARRRWRHGIAARKSDVVAGEKRPRTTRVSITMRTLSSSP